MNLIESIVIALESIKTNKLRSLLTMLGVIIGVSSVIAISAIGQGGQAALNKELAAFGGNRFMINYSYNSDVPITAADLFTLEDVKAIGDMSSAVEIISPVAYANANVRIKSKDISAGIMAIDEAYMKIANFQLAGGRFISREDENARRSVVVINKSMAREISASGDVVGQRIMINRRSFQVVGILEEVQSMFSGGQDNKILYMPITTYFSFSNTLWLDSIEVNAVSQDRVEEGINDSLNILHWRHRNENKYYAINFEKEMQSVKNATGIVALVISAIAGISLLVGGIGIMNIMLVSVTERTREIGIRKALGAQEKDIMIQFLIESLVLSVLGGFLGMVLGFGVFTGVARLIDIPAVISGQMILLALGFSAGVGICFGLYPARKAAYQDPIEALRYE